MIRILLQTTLIFIILMLISCRQEGNHIPPNKSKENSKTSESLIKVNKYLVEKDEKIIAAYAQRMGWNMKTDSAGYWYEIIKHGKGKKAQSGNTISLEYRVDLMDGSTCYSSEADGPKTFKIGQGGVETGLEYAVLKLSEGDSARFIFPPHLAHGLLGDGNCIPSRSTIVYYVNVLNVLEP